MLSVCDVIPYSKNKIPKFSMFSKYQINSSIKTSIITLILHQNVFKFNIYKCIYIYIVEKRVPLNVAVCVFGLYNTGWIQIQYYIHKIFNRNQTHYVTSV